MKDGTKRAIDWLTFIPFGFWLISAFWFQFTHDDRVSVIWIVLMFANLPLTMASILWLIVRMDKITPVRWVIYNIAMYRLRRFLLLVCLVTAVVLLKWLYRYK